jgi:hypothetical protein
MFDAYGKRIENSVEFPEHQIKRWYKNLYKGERWLVVIALILTFFVMVLWATNDTIRARPHPKFIILERK